MFVATKLRCVRLSSIDLVLRMDGSGARRLVVQELESSRVDDTAFHKGLLLCISIGYVFKKYKIREMKE